ncbi:MAG: ankyrin repeat domain-containing protein [Bacteroidota bacterium]
MRFLFLLALTALTACSAGPPGVTIADDPSEADPVGDDFTTVLPPLHRAAAEGDTAAVARLLAGGADVNALAQIAPPPEATATPLHLAAGAGHNPVVKQLIGAGADLDTMSPLYGTPLRQAVTSTSAVLARLVLAGADPSIPDAEGELPIHYALKQGDRGAASTLARGSDPTAPNAEGRSAFVGAASIGAESAVRQFLENGADPTRPDADGTTALSVATDEATRTVLLHWGADPSATVPLPEAFVFACLAALQGNTFALQSWAAQGLDLNRDCSGSTPLITAAASCQADVVSALLEAGASPNVCSADPFNPDQPCASGGSLGSVIYGTYPLGATESALRDAQRDGDEIQTSRCEATLRVIRPSTGRIPQDLRRAAID